MKKFHLPSLTVLAFMVTIFLSCSKKSDPDPRESFVGSWKLEEINGDTPSSPEVIKISNGTSPQTMVVKDWTNDDLEATISSGGFELEDYTVRNVTLGGKKGDITWQNGTGKLKNDQLVMTWDLIVKYTDGTRLNDTWDEVYVKK